MANWVVINMQKIKSEDPNSIRVFGSIRGIANAKLLIDDKPLTYDALRNRISDTRYWTSEKWIIKECKILRNKRKKTTNINAKNKIENE